MRLPACFVCALLGVLPTLHAADAPASAANAPSVAATDEGTDLLLNNGLIAVRIAKEGAATASGQPARFGEGISIMYHEDSGAWTEMSNGQRAIYFDEGGDGLYPLDHGTCKIVSSGPDLAEVAWVGEPGDEHVNRRTAGPAAFPFHTELHAVMKRGDRGFYLYVIYKHDATMPRGNIGETRFVLLGAGRGLFTNHIVDDDRQFAFPTDQGLGAQLQDVTTLHADGSIYTKYNNSTYYFSHHIHGMAGPNYGFWMITPSNEYIGGGPFKQELTVHTGNTLLSMFVGGHFGTAGIGVAQGEVWDKVYGPVFIYFNKGTSLDNVWEDAKKRAAAEYAKWPYAWLKSSDYPLERGTVTGRVALSDGAKIPAARMVQDDGLNPRMNDGAGGTWAILSPMNEDWHQVLKGYDFWAQVDAGGNFSVRNVRPGTYKLTFVGGNQFEEFNQNNVVVKAGTNNLGNLTWPVQKHGQTVWQIGVADHLSFEFKNGDNYRHYENFINQLKSFPHDVTYVIGKSQEAMDWNFAQYAIYNLKPYWTIQFDQPQAQHGLATLTIGFTSADPREGGGTNNTGGGNLRTDLQVKVNGQLVKTVGLPKTGTAGYRSGSSDSNYQIAYIAFDASLLKAGTNEITLGFAQTRPPSDSPYLRAYLNRKPGDPLPLLTRDDPLMNTSPPEQVMYDALRLDVDPAAALPAVER